jgi:subtilase family serine protease
LTDETNNCVASASTGLVTRPDLVETAVSNPPATAARGSGFPVTDSAMNQGGIAAAGTTTRYYLSVDTVKSNSDRRLGGARAVPALGAGELSTDTVTVTVPGNTALGSYYLLACADDTRDVTESDEANNCSASATQVTVTP